MKLKEAAALYIAEKRERRRESTVEGYASALRCHVLPRWGECRIERSRVRAFRSSERM